VVGPLISAAHRDRVEGYVASALSEGGSIIAGGGRPANNTGWYVNPTLVGGVDLGARISQEEIFGPVGVVLPYKTVDEALTIANHTRFGLSANVFSGDLEEALAFSARLQAGTVTINGGGGLRTDAPFGGVKQSGIGREGGEWGVREFLEPQHIQWAL
jgi:aldehyde dehydrogenase (NAD+)/betaine-aldehyde dehydrogenase